MRTDRTTQVVIIDWVKRRGAFSRKPWRRDFRFAGRQLVLFPVALLCAVMLAGCTADGGPHILSSYGSLSGVLGGRRSAPHTGVDFAAAKGDPVIAAADGAVTSVSEHDGCVTLRHQTGDTCWLTRCCHMDQIDVLLAQNVKRGEGLGKAGTAGRSMGVPHVHFALLRCQSSQTVDPLPFIVGCFDPAETVASPALETAGEKPRLVLTYPVRCARRK